MQRTCHLVLLLAILAVGCGDRGKPSPRDVSLPRDDTVKKDDGPKKDGPAPKDGDLGKTVDLPTPKLPEQTRDEQYEAFLHKAIDQLAEQKYDEALLALEEAQKLKDTGAVEREITKVRAVLAQREAAARAVSDVKSVLEDGKPAEAAKLAGEALGQFGDGDLADELAKLQTQAEVEVTAATGNAAARSAALRSDAVAAVKDGNLRAAVIAYEQAQVLAPDDGAARALDDLRDRLRVYDDKRAQAVAARRDAVRLDEARAHLESARKVWDTPQVRQELDEVTLVIERRRDRVSVADFEVRGDVGLPAAGQTVAEELLPHLKRRFDLVERGQLSRVADELKLQSNDLFENTAGLRELGRLAKVRYLVVGSVTPLSGVTAQARLVEVATGLIVQTGRVSAPTIDELVRKLPQLGAMLQMSDEQKAAYEAELQRAVPVVTKIDDRPIEAIAPPPPPPQENAVVTVPPIVTMAASPMPLGGVVIEDFARRLPPPVIITPLAPPPPPPPALAVALAHDDPRRNRMVRLSLELGDNLFRRGRVQEAQRHFSLALTLTGPRREISLRLDNCRRIAPPPPPPVVVVPPPRPVIGLPVVRPPVVFVPPVRARMAVFSFVPSRPGLVPPAASDLLADQMASYFGGYEVIDRGEVCWYMGRLGLTMAQLVNDPVSRRCLAEALNARFFVFGTLRETASMDVETHLIDNDTNQRTATATIHVRDQNELKLRLGELANQLGAKPDDRKALAAAGAASEKALNEARAALAKDPAKAADIAREGLKVSPGSVALRTVLEDANRRQKLAAFEAARLKEQATRAAALEAAKKQQQELALRAAQARQQAEAEAAKRTAAQKKEQDARRDKAADQLRSQAKTALAKGDSAAAVRLLTSASGLKGSDDVFRELAAARAKADADAKAKVLADQQKREAAAKAQREAALARVEKERLARESAEAEKRKAEVARNKTVADGFLKQARSLMVAAKYREALSVARSAQKVHPSAEAEALIRQAESGEALADAARKSAAEKAKVEAELKKREQEEEKARQQRVVYEASLKKAQAAMLAGKYDEAEKEYGSAAKLFKTDVVASGLKAASEMRAREKKAADAADAAKKAEAQKATRLKNLTAQATAMSKNRDHAGAVKALREARQLAPDDVDILAALSRAERDLSTEQARAQREAESKKAKAEAAKLIAAGKAQLNAKKPKEAADFFRRALVQDPTSAEAKDLLGKVEKTPPKNPDYELAMSAGDAAMTKMNFAGAVNAYREALRLVPGDAAASNRLYNAAMRNGEALLAGKKTKEAVAAFDDALKVRPGDGPATSGRKRAEAAMTPPVDAKKAAYDRAMADGNAATKAGKHAVAMRLFDDALAAVPGDKAAIAAKTGALNALYGAVMKNGEALLNAKKFKEAMDAFDRALALKPKDAAATSGRARAEAGLKPPPPDRKKLAYEKAMADGNALLKAGKGGQAVKQFEAALDLYPGDKAATAGKAEATKQMARNREAAYQAALKQGQTLLAGKKFKEAAAAFDEALKLKPNDPAATTGKKQAEAGLKPTPPPDMKKVAYDRAMASGNALLKGGKPGEALKQFDAALALYPGDKAATAGKADATKRIAMNREAAYQAHFKNGQSLLTAKKFAEAFKAFDEALKLKPGDPAAIAGKKQAEGGLKPTPPPPNPQAAFTASMTQARALEKAAKYTEAIPAYEAALKLVASDATKAAQQAQAYAGIGRSQHGLKKFKEAISAYEEALKRTPGNAEVKAALARAKMGK